MRAVGGGLVGSLNPGARECLRLPVASLSDGQVLSLRVNVQVGRRPGPALVVVAGHHGDEYEGPAALVAVWESLAGRDLAGTVVLVPVSNPPAFRFASRRGLDDGIDLNRAFPGRADGTITERIAAVLTGHVLEGADLVLSMHGLSAGYQVEPYIEFPARGATAAVSRAAAESFGLTFLNPFDPGEGRLMTHATRNGLPLIEVEIGGCGCTLPEGRRLYERGSLRLLEHLGMLEATTPSPAVVPALIRRVQCHAPCGGLLRPSVGIGEPVVSGQELAAIFDLDLSRLATVAAPCAGVAGILRVAANVLPGQLVATVFEPIEAAG